MNKISKIVAAGALAVGLAACVNPDYEGEKNKFVVEGFVTDVGEAEVAIVPKDIIEVHGEAKKWFHIDQEHHLHHDYQDEDCDEIIVGKEFNKEGNPQEIGDLNPGEWVTVEGRIRESKISCGKSSSWEYWPVYDEITEINRNQ